MAMSFGGGGGGAQTVQGDDLEQIDTEQLNFHSISGDDKLRLLPSPWPAEQLPPSHASLLTIASGKGLVAAAGPGTLVVAKTESVRNTFRQGKAEGEEKTKSFTPEASLPIPRVSQVAFASDESCLVIAAERGGGLAVYDTNAITSGNKDAAFQIGTNGVSVRQLLPNPNPSAETAHLFGIVLETGQLLLANLKTRELTKSGRGEVIFHDNVASACWSRLGKQIVAGRADGTAVQIDQKGEVKAEIPLPPKLPELAPSGASQMPLMSIYWLDTNDFLLVHTPPNISDGMDSDAPVDSVFHLARRENPKSQAWTFQTVIDPAPPLPFGGRLPPHYFVQRLKDWPPNLDDLLLLISTASTDVGILSKASSALGEGAPTAAFTTTNPPDTNRAGMPMAANGIDDTFALGMALDLSVSETISKPIPRDAELAESPVPLPALCVLNNEGVLRIWYIGYNESIRQKVAFPDLTVAGGPRALDAKKDASAAPSAASSTGSAPAFGAPVVSSPSPFGSTPRPTTSSGPAFGPPSTPSFGGSSAIGQKQSLWGAPPAAPSSTPQSSAPKQPTFGSSTTIAGGTGFAQVGGMGQKASPWGSGGGSTAPTSSFGQPSGIFGGNSAPQSPFAAAGAAPASNGGDAAKPTGSLFGGGKPLASFGGVGVQNTENKSPFAAFSSQQKTPGVPTQSSFASTASLGTSSFGGASTVGGPSLFGTPTPSGSSTGTFGKPSLPVSREESMQGGEEQKKSAAAPSGLFGAGAFKLGSTFTGDGSAKDDVPKPQNPGAGLFGGGFGNALGEAGIRKAGEQPATPIKEEPGTEKQTRLQDIPAAPQSNTPAGLPAKKEDDPLNYKAKRFAGDLPPMDVPGGAADTKEDKKDDPLSYKAKRFTGDVPPVDYPSAQGEVITDEKPVAGSPPIDLGNERFSEEEVPAGPEDDDEEEWSEEEDGEEDGEDEEEGGEDDEEDEESDHEVTDAKGLSAFESRMQPASPTRPDQAEESTTPATEKKAVPSFTPAGLPKGPVFAPPVHESPRSPSPVRSVTAPLAQKATFGQQSKPPMPSLFSRPSTGSQPQQQQPSQAPQGRKEQQSQQQQLPPHRIAVPAAKLAERSTSPVASMRPAEPTTGSLEDEEDARIQALLASAPEPTKDVPAFLAHQDYIGSSSQAGDLAGSIEKLFRDVNSMIDTLGLNAHWLRGFVEGHIKLKADGRRTQEDLEDDEAWTLDEIPALTHVQDEVDEMLEQGRPQNVGGLIEDIGETEQDIRGLRAKAAEMRVRIKKFSDPEQKAANAYATLPEETQTLQMEIRVGVQGVQTLLGKAEEAMSVLRAGLASSSTSAGTEQSKAVPTVEAITNTISKMTAMIERKSGDVDLLESQMRRLPGGIASLNLEEDYEDQLVSSLTGSRLLNGSGATPPSSSMSASKNARSSRMLANGDAPGMNAMFGSSRFVPGQQQQRTPPSGGMRNSRAVFSPGASRLGLSTGSVQNSAVKKRMGDVSEAEIELRRGKVGRRRGVAEALRKEVSGRNGGNARVVRLQG
ncbi:hypothetical protein LTR78_010710 [Recurvomyces mirabilis]|uniref:Nucleoporin Nup159/Nup146 N-terminal domain-containing protein n=1 Tax=Recurvomyces mirabilis TaxID=574656 RepID=A0AAE0TLN1_9PEZI|nr:hypothetical protein LTR78_010710 [Recurvomyces mirabilis]KAK5159604.1 hypothetical protein LTS14_002746 [Recurvomyces mirabilis]